MSEQKTEKKACRAIAEKELLALIEKVIIQEEAASDAIRSIERITERIDTLLEECWDCGINNIKGTEVCVHCGQLMDEEDYRKTMEAQHEHN